MKLTRNQKVAAGAGLALGGFLVWYFWPKGPGRVKKELVIDSNVMSPTFGQPIPQASPEVQALIDRSNAAIAAYDAEHPAEE